MSQTSIPAPTVPLATKAGVVSPQWYIFWAGLQAQGDSSETTLSLEGLSDVSVGGKVTGNVLTWNASLGKWVAGSSGTSGVKINSTQVESFTTQGILRFSGSQLSGYVAVGQGTITNYNVATIVLSGGGGTLSNDGSMAAVGINIPGVEFGTSQVETIATAGLVSGTLSGGILTLSGSVPVESQGTLIGTASSVELFGSGGTLVNGTLAIQPLRAWVNVSGMRSKNTVYYNTFGGEIQLSIATTDLASGAITLMIGGVMASAFPANFYQNLSQIVPPGASYEIVSTGTTNPIASWCELHPTTTL